MSYPSYPEYQDSGNQLLQEVPGHWRVVKLGYLASKIGSGKTPSGGAQSYVDSGITFIRSQNVHDVGLTLDDCAYIDSETDNEMAWSRVHPLDVLFNITGASIGRSCLVPEDFETANVNQHVCIVRLQEPSLLARWVSWVLKSWPSKKQVDLSQTGAAREGLNFEQLSSFQLCLPPFPEREQIARFLDHQTARIDALIAEQQRLIELLKEKRQAVISHAVTKGLDPDVAMKDSGVEWLGEVPEHWSTGRVGWWFDVELGKMLDESRITGESLAPYIRNTDVQWNGINTEDLPVMDFNEADRIRYGLRKGDLLVCEGGEIGRAAIWQNDDFTCFYQKALHRVRARKEGNVHFLKHVLRHYADNGILDGSSTSATINHFTREQFRALSIPFPPAGEQAEIADYIDSKSNDFDALEEQANAGIELLKERRSALISAAVTGKIDVRDWQPPSSKTFPDSSVNEGATA